MGEIEYLYLFEGVMNEASVAFAIIAEFRFIFERPPYPKCIWTLLAVSAIENSVSPTTTHLSTLN